MILKANSIRTGALISAPFSKSIHITFIVDDRASISCYFYIGVLSPEKSKELKEVLSFTEIVEFYYDDGKIITHSPDGVVRVFVNEED